MAEVPLTRATLLLRLRDPHDEAAWTEFVDLYAPLVYGYARKQGLQDADAADLTQDVLGAVAGAVGRLEYDPARGAFRNCLFTIVRRKLANWRAAQDSRPRGSGDAAIHQLLEQCPAPVAEAEWDAEWEVRVFAWACAQVRRDVTDTTWQAFWRTAIDGQPSKPAPSSFLDVTLGQRFVEGVEESGFYYDEENELGPFRWTDGRGRLVIPLDKRNPPQALFVQLQRPHHSWLQIMVNERELVNEKARDVDMDFWEKTLDLSGIDLGDKLVVEIVSNTLVPSVQQAGRSDDARALGVTVREIKMLRQAGSEQTEPARNSFLNVTVGHRSVPGVDDAGFYHHERDKDGWFRWTKGKGRLAIPLDKTAPRPQALWMQLDQQRNSFLKITVNQRVLADEPANNGMRRRWEWTLDLRGIDLGEKLVVEIVSGTSVPAKDPRVIGLRVRGIKLLREMGEEKVSADKVTN